MHYDACMKKHRVAFLVPGDILEAVDMVDASKCRSDNIRDLISARLAKPKPAEKMTEHRVHMLMDSSLLAKLDEFAQANKITRTTAICDMLSAAIRSP